MNMESIRHRDTFAPSLHLVPFGQLWFAFVSCVDSRVVESSWMVLLGVHRRPLKAT